MLTLIGIFACHIVHTAQDTELTLGIFSPETLLITGDEITKKYTVDMSKISDEEAACLYSEIEQNRPQWCLLSLNQAHTIQRAAIWNFVKNHSKHLDNEMKMAHN